MQSQPSVIAANTCRLVHAAQSGDGSPNHANNDVRLSGVFDLSGVIAFCILDSTYRSNDRVVLVPCLYTGVLLKHLLHGFSSYRLWIDCIGLKQWRRLVAVQQVRQHVLHVGLYIGLPYGVYGLSGGGIDYCGSFTEVDARRPQLVLGWVTTRKDQALLTWSVRRCGH